MAPLPTNASVSLSSLEEEKKDTAVGAAVVLEATDHNNTDEGDDMDINNETELFTYPLDGAPGKKVLNLLLA